MSGAKPEVFRGNLEDCFAHYASGLPKGSAEATQAKTPIAHFAGVGVASVTRWIAKDGGPLGETWLRVAGFLMSLGYTVTDITKLDHPLRDLAEIVSYGIVRLPDAAKQLGYTETSNLMRILTGRAGISDDKRELVRGIVRTHRSLLERVRSSGILPDASPASTTPAVADPGKGSVPPAQAVGRSLEEAKDDAELLAYTLLTAGKLSERIAASTPEVRRGLALTVGTSVLLRSLEQIARLHEQLLRDAVST